MGLINFCRLLARCVTGADGVSGHPLRVWHLRMLESGEGFAIGCARLGNNTDLAEVRQRYGLGELAPICGDHPPVPVNWQELK